MALNFFDNFRQAAPIYSGPFMDKIDSEGNVRLYDGRIQNLNQPDAVGERNTSDYENRIAVPFHFNTRTKNGELLDRSGILYMPASEKVSFSRSGDILSGVGRGTFPDTAEIYGAEIDGQSLDVKGMQQLLNDNRNTNFMFDMGAGTSAESSSTGNSRNYRTPTGVVSTFRGDSPDFIRALRTILWGK